jgi:hypothetical protein
MSFKMLSEVVGLIKHEAVAFTVLGMYSKGSFRGGIGDGCPGTCEYDHEGSSVGRVS